MTEPADGYAFDTFRVDVTHRQLLREDQPVALGHKTFDTLVLLIRHRDRVVGKDEIIGAVWPDSFVSEDSLTQSVSALRRVLGDEPAQPRFIATVARRGYRFIAPVTEIRAEQSSTAPVEHPLALSADAPTAASLGHASPHEASVHDASVHETAAAVAIPMNPGLETRASTPIRSRTGLWAGAVSVAALLVLGVIWMRAGTASSPTVGPLHFVLDLPARLTLASGGLLSPDSRHVVFVAQDEDSGKTQLWLRSLAAPGSRPLEGTDGALRPFWSPDSQFVAFFAGSKLKRVGLTSGAAETLAPTVGARPAGGSWSRDGLILYSDAGALSSVPAAGGASTVVRAPDPAAEEVSLRSPQFLPDGRHYLYVVGSQNLEKAGTFVGTIGSAEKIPVLGGTDSSATFAPPNYLAFVRDRALMAQAFDLSRFSLTGEPRMLAGSVSANPVISASAAGLFAFGGGATAERLQWFDRTGRQMGSVDAPTVLHNLTLSPDQRQVLGSSGDPGQNGIWLIDIDRGAAARLVPSAGAASWSADGSHITFAAADYSGAGGIHRRAVVGKTEDELLLATADPKVVNDWSRDDQYIVFVSGNLRTKNDIWMLPRTGTRVPVPLVQTPANEIQGHVSPDGHWLAYASDETGSWEVYAQAFPAPGAKRSISVGGGSEPQWRADGKEMFYISPDHMMMAVDVTPGTTLQVGRPKPLFRVPVLGSLSDYLNYYVATADGERFLVTSVARGSAEEPITVLVNWTALLGR